MEELLLLLRTQHPQMATRSLSCSQPWALPRRTGVQPGSGLPLASNQSQTEPKNTAKGDSAPGLALHHQAGASCSQPGQAHAPVRVLGHGELEAPSLSQARELNPSPRGWAALIERLFLAAQLGTMKGPQGMELQFEAF